MRPQRFSTAESQSYAYLAGGWIGAFIWRKMTAALRSRLNTCVLDLPSWLYKTLPSLTHSLHTASNVRSPCASISIHHKINKNFFTKECIQMVLRNGYWSARGRTDRIVSFTSGCGSSSSDAKIRLVNAMPDEGSLDLLIDTKITSTGVGYEPPRHMSGRFRVASDTNRADW